MCNRDLWCIKMYNMIKKIFFIGIILYSWHMQCQIIGSDSSVSVQGPVTFLASGNATNEMRGFANFLNGFTLASNLTQCLFTSYFPVSGPIAMNGGLLNLGIDLHLSDTLSFVSTGTINGNNFAMYFPPFDGTLSVPSTINSSSLSLVASQAQIAPVNTVDWSYDNQYIAVGTNQTGTANNLFILQYNGVSLTTLTSLSLPPSATGNLAVLSVRWHPTTYTLLVGIASSGATDNHIYVYIYNPVANTLTLAAGPNPITTGTSCEAVAWSPNGNFFLYGTLISYHIVSYNSSTGTVVTDFGQVTTNATSENCIAWEPNGNFFVIGYNAASPQLIIYAFNGSSSAVVQLSDAIGFNVSALAVDPLNRGFIVVGLSGSTTNLQIFQHSIANNTLTLVTSVAETSNVLSADWSPDGTEITVGLAAGATTEFRTYSFNANTPSLTLKTSITSANSYNATRWSKSPLNCVATGDSGDNVNIYCLPSQAGLVLQNLKAILNGDIVLTTTMLILGSCEIEGNGYKLDLTQTSSFTIGSGANLLLKNMTIKGISGTVINFVDSTGVLGLRDVTWVQNGSYTFTNGAFTITNDVLFTGTSNFIYSSTKTSTINSNAQLMLDNGMTFSYASTNAKNLLAMTDQTSQLYLLNTSLFAPVTGWQLTKGSLFVDGFCNVTSLATSQANGILFGDGASSANDLTIKILPESGFNLNSGFLVYNNV